MRARTGPKRLDEMDELRDMGRFPLPIYLGATANVLQTIGATYFLRGRAQGPLALALWSAGVIATNVTPVIALRRGLDEHSAYPPIAEMDFFADQHKFAPWVYGVASANMLAWIIFAWTIFGQRRTPGTLLRVLLVAAVATLLPAWIRPFTARR